MSLHPHHNESTATVDLLSAIEELAENSKARVNSRRGNNRVELNCAVRVAPANASERGKFLFEGSCRDLSPTGGRLILNQAMLVGDVYLIYLEGENFRLDPTFVRCIRCHLIREGDFECGVSFLSPVDLESALAPISGVTTSVRPPSTSPVSSELPSTNPFPAAAAQNTAPVQSFVPVTTPVQAQQVAPTQPFAQAPPAAPEVNVSPVANMTPTPNHVANTVTVDVPPREPVTHTNVTPEFDTNPGAVAPFVASTNADAAPLEQLPSPTNTTLTPIEPVSNEVPVLREEVRTQQVQVQPKV